MAKKDKKNNNKKEEVVNTTAQTVKDTPKTDLKETSAPQPAGKTVKETKKPEVKKEEPKVEVPKEDASGIVETPEIEEVKNEKPVEQGSSLVPPSINELYAKMGPSDMMDANHAAVFMDTMERRLAKMDKSKPLYVKMESLLDYNMMWYAIRLSVQSFAQKREMNMITPNDETIVQEAINIAASMGVALEAHPTPDNQQMVLEFKEKNMDKDTIEAAKAENVGTETAKKSKRTPLTPEEMDPKNWKNDEDAKRALQQDIQATQETPANKFLRLLGKVKTYRENIETDPVKKNMWGSVTFGTLTKELISLIGKKGIIVLNGLMSATTGSMKLGQTMIFAHSTIKNNMPALRETEIADLLKTFIELMHTKADQPLDQDPAIVKGILEPTRDTFVRIALQKPAESENPDWFKKIFNPFLKAYRDEIGSKVNSDGHNNPDFYLKAANKMIEIRNLYVDKEAQFPLFTSADMAVFTA